ncbi:MAG TPA: CHRD domain-containing protein [Candidatus Limnocylindrales bacterium]|nr:CHRD domain-containing protein [Candidatus Limnocylindrales bacterium]
MRLFPRLVPILAAVGLLLALAGPASAARTGVFRLLLTGDQEATATCAPPAVCGDPDAAAAMILIVNPNTDSVCFLTKWTDIDGTVVASHIHLAPAGVPGPVVVPLFSGSFSGTDKTRGCVSANGLADDILANPSAYYVNIHSTVFPAGAVRAQLG